LHHEVVLAKAKPSLAAMIFAEGGMRLISAVTGSSLERNELSNMLFLGS
jgi:hypothetical protein